MLDKGSRALKEMHYRNRMRKLNKNLDEVEEGIMTLMRLESNDPNKELGLHSLIGERERIKYMLKDFHNKLYA